MAAFALCCATTVTLVTAPVKAQQKVYSGEVMSQIVQGRKLTDAGKLQEARQAFAAALKADPSCALAYDGIGLTYLRQDDYGQADQALRKALNCDPLNVEILNHMATATYNQGHYDESIIFYKQALSLARPEEDFRLRVNLANVLRDKGDVQEACEQYEQAVKEKPDYAPAYNNLAVLYYNNGKLDIAAEEAKKAIRFKPNYAMAYYHLGLIESARHNTAAATDALQQSLKYESNPRYIADTQKVLKRLLNQGGQTASTGATGPSLPGFVSMLGGGGKDGGTSGAKATQYLRDKQWKLAQREIEDLIKEPGGMDDAYLWNNLGYAWAHQGKDGAASAIAAYKRAIGLAKSGFPTAQYNMGIVLQSMGSDSDAEHAFKQAIEDAKDAHTTFPLAQNALGLLLKKRGDLKGADAAYRRAIAQSGVDLPVAHYNRAIVLEKLDNTREAVREYKAYLTLAPRGLNVKQARVRLKRLGIEIPNS